MNVQQILLILAARYKLALLVMAATVALAFVGCLLLPKKYTAITTVVVDNKTPDPVSGLLMQAGVIPQINLSAAAEAEIITSERVARRVVRMLKLDQDPEILELWRDDTDGRGSVDVWLGELLLKKVSVRPASLQSNVLPIKFAASDPEFAAAVANAFAQAYIEVNIELKVEPAKHYVAWFTQQEKVLRAALEKAQAKLSKYLQEKRIVATDELRDTEMTRLNELTQQLNAVQGQFTDILSKEGSSDADALPDVAQNNLITGLKSNLARQEAKLQELAGNLGLNHPQFQRLESEIAALRENLQAERRNIIKGFSASRRVYKTREVELQAAIEAQKNKLLRIKNERDHLAVLQREVEAAKKALDAVLNRLQQSTLDSQATQTNVSILTPAVPPLEPSFPKLVLYTLLAIPAGLLLAVAAAYAYEMHDGRVRSRADLAGMLQAPVLAVIEPPGERRRRFFGFSRGPALAAK
jgi:chain length determinant protein EpsF